jgi:hypothetical protein
MSTTTITEALAEIKTIGKRLEKKRQAVLQNLGRDSRLKDPFLDAENPGGSLEYIKRERQAILDLEKRIVAIRSAIQKANFATRATINGETMSVQEWLNFRREVSPNRQIFLNSMNTGIKQTREKLQREGGRVTFAGAAASAIATVEGEKKPPEILLHIDEKALLEEQENLEKTLGELDGKLSLLNATTIIEV